MNLIRRDSQNYLPFILKKTVIFHFVYSLPSANIDQSAPNLGKIFMTNRIWMSWIMGPIGAKELELFAFELGKISAFDFVYSLASKNITN